MKSCRNVAFCVPKTPLRGFPEAFEFIRWKIDGEGVPETLVLGGPAKASGSYYGDDKAKPIIARFMVPRSSRARTEEM
jgi:hypothetical protein